MEVYQKFQEASLYYHQGLNTEAKEILEEILNSNVNDDDLLRQVNELLNSIRLRLDDGKPSYRIEDSSTKTQVANKPAETTTTLNKDEIDRLLKEAEYYAHQGLYKEASNIFHSLPKDIFSDSHPFAEKFKERLKFLEASLQNEDFIHQSPASQTLDIKKTLENATGLMEAGFFTEAIAELKSLLEAGIKHGSIYAKIAEAYLSLDQPYDAIDNFNEALKDTRLNKDLRLKILYQLAVLYEKNGAIPQAIAEYERILRIDPNYANVRQTLETLTKTSQKYGQFYYLIKNQYITPEKLEEAKEKAKKERKSVESVLINDFNIDKTHLGESLSEYYNVPYKDFNPIEILAKPDCIQSLSEHFLRANSFVPIYEDPSTIIVAVDNPNDMQKQDLIKKALSSSLKKNKKIEYALCFKDDIDKYIDYFYDKIKKDSTEIDFEQLVGTTVEETPEEVDTAVTESDSVIVKLVNKIIDDAYAMNASDIHIECNPDKEGAQIRFRVDGDCRFYQKLPSQFKRAVVSRIKIMSGLDISERRLPQDGKIKFRTKTGKIIELRVATIPTIGDNEDVVMRILASAGALPLDKIGLLEQNYKRFEKMVTTPYGLIFVVGPTGSGKTTTLHAALNYVNKENKKIWTAEDPVEIVQKGLRQVQVKPSIGLTFARVMRAFLRADPDIIMIGETRDQETAHIVIEASLTGHLVFSTLHTNSAPETVTRLLGMGIDPYNFADALIGVLAQRLAKRLCSNCKEPYEPTEEEIQMLIDEYGDHPVYPLTPESFKGVTLYRAVGCKKCDNRGYKGRLGIHELLENNDEIKRLIIRNAPVQEIFEAAKRNGMLTLKQDGIQKVLRGETDIYQVRAVCAK